MTIDLRTQAREAATRQYALAHDRWAEQEQLLKHEGREIEAAGARELGARVLRAWLAEQEDPEP